VVCLFGGAARVGEGVGGERALGWFMLYNLYTRTEGTTNLLLSRYKRQMEMTLC
jgi:hypothetical protein